MRILFVHDLLDFRSGGAVSVVFNLLTKMNRARFDCLVAAPGGPAPISERFYELDVPVHVLPDFAQTSDRSMRGVLASAGELLRCSWGMLRVLIRERPDFVYVHSVTTLHFAVLPALLLRVPVVYHEHNLPSGREGSLWAIASPWLIRRARHVIAIAESIRKEIVGLGVPEERTSTIQNGIPVEGAFEAPSGLDETNSESSGFRVIQIANLLPWKGHEVVIRSAALIRGEIPGLQFVFYGNSHDEGLERRLRKLVAELDLESVIVFGGYRDDVDDLLPEFDALVVASDAEPFGLVVLEAMRAHVPVVATRSGGVPEIVTDGRDGLLFEPGAHDELAACLIRLARDREKSRELVIAGWETLNSRFTDDAQARNIGRVFESLG